MSQRMWVACGNWKDQGNEFSSKASRKQKQKQKQKQKNTALVTSLFLLSETCVGLLPTDCKIRNLHYLYAKFVVIYCNCDRKLIQLG